MIKRIPVKLDKRSYDIVVGSKILTRLGHFIKPLKLGSAAIVITHPVIWRLHGASVQRSLQQAGFHVDVITVPEGEKSKSAACAMKVVEKIARLDLNKKVFCVALGGGVIGDLTGFVAAIYKRGVPYIQVPTSLLAQVDSAIGGKTAIDLTIGKNLVGAFYQPRMVVADTAVLTTLSHRQMQNGMAEIIKYGIIADGKLFTFIEQNGEKFFKHDPRVLTHLIATSAAIKANVVSKDEYETKGLRLILNFGHTVGHAIEAAGGFTRYQHGESVALGMRIAARLSVLLKLFKSSDEKRLNQLIDRVGLPSRVKGISLGDILKHMRHDKKFVAGKNRFVLATAVGRVIVKAEIPQALIDEAIKPFLTR